MDGGQSFRWSLATDGSWVGVFGHTLAAVRSGPQGLEWRSPRGAAHAEDALRYYLDAEGAQARLSEALPWRSDPVLRSARAAYPGLRILRQEPHEALVGFLCSSNKRILQIRVMVAALATKLGVPLGGDFYAMPSWEAIAGADEAVLRACSLGYRAAYLRGTAKKLLARPRWAEEFAALETPALLAELQSLPGVGPKVAACVALFGFGRLESFPVDTWVVQALADAYDLRGWKPAQLEQFGKTHFGAAAGLAQQYLFSAARNGLLSRAAVSVPKKPKRPRPRK
ncbi:MAG: DNA glycosylase [Verrucomicrobiota bacterium]